MRHRLQEVKQKQQKFYRCQKNFQKPKKSNEQLETKDMAELESEECAAERRNQEGQGLKILTPD